MIYQDKSGRKLTLKLICKTCKKAFWSIPNRRGKGINLQYCSRTCYTMRGSMNPHWRGGKLIYKYIFIYIPKHPYANKDGYVLEHRLVMEKVLKRYLKSSEVVHHLNHNKHDNSPKNLHLCENQSDHMRNHKIIRNKENGRIIKIT